MPARILYVGQQVAISPYNTGVSITRYLPVQSVSCEVSRPIEDILSFGRFGSLGRVQTSVSTCKADIKTYLPFATGTGLIADSSRNNLLDSLLIQSLTGEALLGQETTISVTPNGFTMSGILTNLGVEVTNGAFATVSMSFAGVGEPDFANAPTTLAFTQQTNMPATFTPVVSNYVSGAVNTGCANSFRFSLDLPTETISCLGANVSGGQTSVTNHVDIVAKAPFKASISVEGTAVEAPIGASGSSVFTVGRLSINLPQGMVTSRSFNNAVGNVGASYNYTLEDVNAVFNDFGLAYP